MLNLCWDSFYLDTSFSRRHLCLQFVRDIITIFGRTGGVWHQGTEVASQTQGQAALLPIQVELVHWITGEENESHFQQLIGLFHDSVQMNKVSHSQNDFSNAKMKRLISNFQQFSTASLLNSDLTAEVP